MIFLYTLLYIYLARLQATINKSYVNASFIDNKYILCQRFLYRQEVCTVHIQYV